MRRDPSLYLSILISLEGNIISTGVKLKLISQDKCHESKIDILGLIINTETITMLMKSNRRAAEFGMYFGLGVFLGNYAWEYMAGLIHLIHL